METVTASFGSEETMTLQAAVMLYSNQQGGSFATAHNIAFDSKGVPLILEGHPLTMKILNALNTSIAKGSACKRVFHGYLPENILAVGTNSIVWWLPAGHRTVSFACDDELIGTRSGKTPHPSLVFGVNGDNWAVYAVKGNCRPKPETCLWQAPYFNVWEGGNICEGSSRVPNGATTAQIDGWNRAFFESNFSHPNIHEPGKLVNYKGGPYTFWRDMLDGVFQFRFPQRVLVETPHTLDDFITSTLNGEN